MKTEEATKVVLKNISRNVFASIISLCISVLVGLIFPVFVIKVVGNDKYGLWVLWLTWLSIIQIALFGVNSSILSILANLTETPQKFWSSFKSYGILSSSTALVITVICCFLCISFQANNVSFWLISILFLSFILRIFSELLILPTKIQQRYDRYYIQQNVYQLSFLIISLGLITINQDLISLILASILSGILQIIVCYIYFLESLKRMDFSLNCFFLKTPSNWGFFNEFRHLGRLDVINMIYSIASIFLVRQTIPIISDIKGLTYYDLATRITSQVYSLAAIAFSNIIPSMAYLNHHSPNSLSPFISKSHRYLTIVVILLLSFLIVYSPHISLVLISNKNTNFIFVLSLLSLDAGLNLTTGIYTNALLALKNIDIVTKKYYYHLLVLTIATLMAFLLKNIFNLNLIKYITILTVGNLMAIFFFYAHLQRNQHLKGLQFLLFPWLKLMIISLATGIFSAYTSTYFLDLIFDIIFFDNNFAYIILGFVIFLLTSSVLMIILRIIDISELKLLNH